MDAPKRYHSVQLDKSRCKGCTNCLMHCPTEAIRVRDGRAHIIAERCIDCGECIRICDYHAKVAVTDKFDTIKAFRYAIALPAPSLYGQFRNLQSGHNCEPADVGVFFITPCPAKMTAIRSPIGQQKSCVDGAISMMEIYGLLRPYISQNAEDVEAEATSYGIGWAASSGEAKAVCPDNSLVVDGIENCSRVLEEIENNKLSDLVFFEGNACTGGCVGGPLTFENNYVAKNAIRKLVDNARQQRPERPAQSVPASMMTKYPLYMDAPILPNSAIQLDSDITVALDKMERINQILQDLPGYDCGSCGSPTCRTFAEDIVCGYCNEMFCIHKLKDRLKVMAQQMVELAQMKRE